MDVSINISLQILKLRIIFLKNPQDEKNNQVNEFPTSDDRRVFILFLLYLFATIDYLSRSPDDFDMAKMNCGKLESANYSSSHRGGSSVTVKINSSDGPDTFSVGYPPSDLDEQLSKYVGKKICIRYVRSPLMFFLKYPMEIYQNKKVIVPWRCLDRGTWIEMGITLCGLFLSLLISFICSIGSGGSNGYRKFGSHANDRKYNFWAGIIFKCRSSG